MSADVLREAAALMRSRAEAAGKPWHPWGDSTLPERSRAEAWASDMDATSAAIGAFTLARGITAVALAVADWLDAQAALIEHSGDFFDEDGCDSAALAVARAYLGTAT
jgi:hypothetical protein